MSVVFYEKSEGDFEVVDVVKDEGVLRAVGELVREEVHGVLAPVATWVEVVRGVVPVVETVSVALFGLLVAGMVGGASLDLEGSRTYGNVD